ncbi:MAG: right-handed parallel beta-helix repeat-containing protein [Planctomycetaceae bacterium]|nr:right-handed parallel beta-helix repeat-containing protein [Planctomycetaceae bacterium]
MNRRGFFSVVGFSSLVAMALRADEDGRPKVTSPRATSGDTAVEPNWDERLTISVGNKEGDLIGSNEKVLQAAVDTVARLGGGTVKVLPGTYRLRNSVYLASKVRIVGSGAESVLIKEPSTKTKLMVDSDWYDQEVTLEDANGFRVGDGVVLRCKNPHNGGATVLKRTLVARSGKRFKLDKALRENVWQMGEPTAATLFPLISGEFVSDCVIENITLDGNREKNDHFDGNYSGCIFLQDCQRMTMRGVEARNNNGDGISWQICHDVVVENCHSHDNADLGLHPGSGSQRPLIRGNRIERCNIGIFFCWGVKYGLAEKNTIEGIRTASISIGHRDTDNIVRDNVIKNSGVAGVLFRPERGPSFAGHRNRIERNEIVNSGGDEGVGIDIQGGTESIELVENRIVEQRGSAKRIGIRLGAETKNIQLTDNRIEGVAQVVTDLRQRQAAK